MLAKLFDLINRTDTLVVDDQVIDTVGFCDNFMPDQQVMLARLSIDDTDYHFADQEVDLDNGCAMAVALVWGMDGAEEVKVSMAFKVEVMLPAPKQFQVMAAPWPEDDSRVIWVQVEDDSQLVAALSGTQAHFMPLDAGRLITREEGLDYVLPGDAEALTARLREEAGKGRPAAQLIEDLRDLARRQHSMLADLHNNYGWDELCATMEEITDEARELGIEVEL